MPEPGQPQTPPNGWEFLPRELAQRSPEELVIELINLFRQLLAVAQALVDLLEQRLAHPEPNTRAAEMEDIPII